MASSTDTQPGRTDTDREKDAEGSSPAAEPVFEEMDRVPPPVSVPIPEPPPTEQSTSHPRDGISNLRWIWVLISLYLGGLLYGLDTTIAADVQGPVYESLGEIENLPWVGIGFPVASVAVILLLGKLYTLVQTKPLALGSILVFEIGSAVCGAAPSMSALIVGRVIAGMGGAGMYLGALTFIATFSTKNETPVLIALLGLSWGVGAILGPVIGGAFSDSSATWRWAFYINLPLAGVLSPVYIFWTPDHNPCKDLSLKSKLEQIDWLGAVLMGAIFVLFTIAVAFSGSTYAWDSPAAITLWIIWGICLISLILQQATSIGTTPTHRIFPVHFLRKPELVLLYAATAASCAANGIVVYYVPLFFQITRGESALQAAVRLLPYIVLFIFSVVVAGGLLPLVQRYSFLYVLGGVLTTAAGAVLFAILDSKTGPPLVYGCEVLLGMGLGATFQTGYAAATAVTPRSQHPDTIGYINVAQIGTTAIALAMAGCLFQNLGIQQLRQGFEGIGFKIDDDVLRSALAGALASSSLANSDPTIVQVIVVAMATTIRRVFGMLIGAGAAILVCSVFMPWRRINLEGVAEAELEVVEESDEE